MKYYTFLLINVIFFSFCKNTQNMTKSHSITPEPILFLELAASAFEEYFEENKTYPMNWYQLDFTFVNGPYNINDSNIKATKQDENKWQPKKCLYTYIIKNATSDNFRIIAVNSAGVIEYEIVKGMETPIKIIN